MSSVRGACASSLRMASVATSRKSLNVSVGFSSLSFAISWKKRQLTTVPSLMLVTSALRMPARKRATSPRSSPAPTCSINSPLCGLTSAVPDASSIRNVACSPLRMMLSPSPTRSITITRDSARKSPSENSRHCSPKHLHASKTSYVSSAMHSDVTASAPCSRCLRAMSSSGGSSAAFHMDDPCGSCRCCPSRVRPSVVKSLSPSSARSVWIRFSFECEKTASRAGVFVYTSYVCAPLRASTTKKAREPYNSPGSYNGDRSSSSLLVRISSIVPASTKMTLRPICPCFRICLSASA
mmetsp:Transcript_16543/g.53988  ORF Transcript_16543/g.53988 Transcript_16543/m.53988 type:complete len:296 (-) Transcript_16543:614-1501(-)